MEKELALRVIGYLIGYYKTHEETTIDSQEIEAINYILDENEKLETQLKKQKEIIDKVRKIFEECKMLLPHEFDLEEQVDNALNILKEV